MEKLTFPQGFLLGAASSSHQVEGNNNKNDWWYFEQQGRLPKSGGASDHYHKFEEDFDIAKLLGLNAMRISVEWSRIEPEEGKWDMAELEHYRKVLQSLKARGMTRMVTLHHFTLPLWFSNKGGFLAPHAKDMFARYAEFVAKELGDEMEFLATINEPGVYNTMGYLVGKWPPFKKSLLTSIRIHFRLAASHLAVYRAVKKVKKDLPVGIVVNCSYFEPARPSNIFDKFLVKVSTWVTNYKFLNDIIGKFDFIGLNYYFSRKLKFPNRGFEITTNQEPRTDMHWPIKPEGLYPVLLALTKYKKPIYITENGLADSQDKYRRQFIYDHLKAARQAMDKGADIRGYFYWSLTDNFEWADGYGPRFGLVEINYENQQRIPRPSSSIFKEINIQI